MIKMIIFIENNKNITLKGNKHLEIIAGSYDIGNTSLHKPGNIIQIRQQDAK